MPEEVWLPVADQQFASIYEISSHGRLRRLVNSGRGRAGSFVRGHKCAAGHRRVELKGHGAERRVFLHRLVIEAFVGPCPDGMECCHNDGNPENNSIANLRWDTRSGNQRDRTDGYVNHRGEHSGRAKLSNATARRIRAGARSIYKLAEVYGLHPTTIARVKRGDSYKDA